MRDHLNPGPGHQYSCFGLCLVLALCQPCQADAGNTQFVDGWKWSSVAPASGPSWTDIGFDDSKWELQLPTGTVNASESTLLVRRLFVVDEPKDINQLILTIASDAPFVAYLNGIEVVRTRKALPWSTDSGVVRGFPLDITGFAEELLPGANVIAIAVQTAGGRPLFFHPELSWASHEDSPETVRSEKIDPQPLPPCCPARYVIVLIADGWGAKHIEATQQFYGEPPLFESDPRWIAYWTSTFPDGGAYDAGQAWSDFAYVLQGYTDSAAAATALFAGVKTANGRISVNTEGNARLSAISEKARRLGMVVGAVTTVPLSHATPAAFTSHNLSRANAYAIADEAFFTDPNTTGTPATDSRYSGGMGPTSPSVDVLIGDRSTSYVSVAIQEKLANDSGLPGSHVLVRAADGVDGGAALLAAATLPWTLKLAGLFDRVDLRVTALNSGYVLETPTLAESADAALAVLEKGGNGFVLIVEGGAVDWASHANDMDRMIGEMRDFEHAVEHVVDWVDGIGNGSSWSNTLVVVTGDHETGYLTRAPGVFPDVPFDQDAVNMGTLGLEKIDVVTGRRASWMDNAPANDTIDPGETVFWSWNSGSHTNSLIPLFARGVGAGAFREHGANNDPVRGPYLDNTDVHTVVNRLVQSDNGRGIFCDGFETGNLLVWSFTH